MLPSALTLKIINANNPIDSFTTADKLTEPQKALITMIAQTAVREHIKAQNEYKKQDEWQKPQNRMLKLKEVAQITALSRSSIYLYVKRGTFPAPVKLGERSSAWKESEVRDWLDKAKLYK